VNGRLTKIFSIFIYIYSSCVLLNAQQLNIKNFSIDDGLPQSQALSIFQDHTGIIWFTTNGGGISRFDGIKFHNLSTKDGLNNNRVNCAFEDSHQRIWIGTAKGINRFVNNKLYKVSDTLINQLSIYRIHEHSNGEIWFGTSKGIYIFNGEKFYPFEFNDILGNYQVWGITEDGKGNTWMCSILNGLFCYDGKKVIHYGKNEGISDLKNRDIIFVDNKLWLSSYRGISVCDLSNANKYDLKFEPLILNGKPFIETTYCFYKDASGPVWIGCSSGVYKIDNNKVRYINRNNGLCNSMIVSIIKDKEGNMWFGSFGGGVSKYRNDLFVNINEQQGLANNTVMSFLKDRKNNMWIGTWGGGVSKLDFSAWQNHDTVITKNFAQKEGLPFNNIWSMCEDKSGNIWFGTSSSGLSVYNGKTFTNYYLKDGIHGLRIPSIVCDRKGNVWIANENGVDKFDGTNFTFYGEQQGFSSQGVNAIYEDKLGVLWFGSPDKIIKYDGKLFTSILRKEGFPRLRNIIKDKFGYMWFSTDAGACVYTGQRFNVITENDGLSSNTVYYVKEDNDGNIWMGTNNGIDKLDLNQYVNKKEIVLKHYGKEEGFIGLECNQNAFYKDNDGKLWIGTIGGATIFDPTKENKNTIEPQTTITNIRLSFKDVDFSSYSDSLLNGLPQNLSLPYNKNHITFDFIGVCQTIPDKVKYQFMLEGADSTWLPEGKELSATYSNLAPGKYTFKLKASNNDGVWNAEPIKFSFEIVPPFWKRMWFMILIGLMGISLIYMIINIRERSLIHSQKILEEQVASRTYELQQEKEKLQSAYSEIGDKNKDITNSIIYAKRIQEAILPPDLLIKQLLPESFVLYTPKDIVSGDFYWVEKHGEEVLIAAVDCTGHGVPGAFMSIVGHNILTQTVNGLGVAKPSTILNQANIQLSKKLNQDTKEKVVRDGMDIALCSINYSKMKLEYAGANNPLWLIRNNEFIQIKGNKFPIGAYVTEELQLFTNHVIDLEKGDCIYIFTDGYADQFGGLKGKKFKRKELQKLLIEHHTKTVSEQKNIFEKTIEQWRGNLEQVDDILIIGIKI
jgi:ligand-binding sensor domain-containing protein/serine phosphatase RsbU (regulator of sigma subunit)